MNHKDTEPQRANPPRPFSVPLCLCGSFRSLASRSPEGDSHKRHKGLRPVGANRPRAYRRLESLVRAPIFALFVANRFGQIRFASPLRFRRLFAPLCLGGSILLLASPAFAAPSKSPLADALEKKDLAAARALLRDANVNTAQIDGMTPLHWAVHHDDLATAKLLLVAQADPNATNRYGVTPLSLACTNGHAAMVTLLLDRGADPATTLKGGETPLMTAARTGQVEAVKALLARGVDVNAKLEGGQTALMWAASEGHLAVVEALLAAKADFTAPLSTGFTPMLFAVRAGHIDLVRTFLKAGIDINAVTDPAARPGNKQLRRRASALTLAVENGRFELATVLLDLGADPNDMRSGYTPLHTLAWIRKPDIGEDEGNPVPEDHGRVTSEQLIRKLVAKGANVNAQLDGGPKGGARVNRKGCTPDRKSVV